MRLYGVIREFVHNLRRQHLRKEAEHARLFPFVHLEKGLVRGHLGSQYGVRSLCGAGGSWVWVWVTAFVFQIGVNNNLRSFRVLKKSPRNVSELLTVAGGIAVSTATRLPQAAFHVIGVIGWRTLDNWTTPEPSKSPHSCKVSDFHKISESAFADLRLWWHLVVNIMPWHARPRVFPCYLRIWALRRSSHVLSCPL